MRDDFTLSQLPPRIGSKIVTASDGCWTWTSVTNRDGYGKVSFHGKYWLAHRVTYTLLVGEIPSELQIDHLCRNRACVNPAHLETVTQSENTRRGAVVVRHLRCRPIGGAPKLIPSGTRVGQLTVLDIVPDERDIAGGVWWRCRCDCGRLTVVRSNSLRSGKTRSCGCLRGRPFAGVLR